MIAKAKGIIDNLYKKNKSIAVGLTYFLILFVVNSTISYMHEHINTINSLQETVSSNDQRIASLEGRFSVIEQLFYDLNRSQLQKVRFDNGTYHSNTADR